MAEHSIEKTDEQCRTKVKNLRQEYKKISVVLVPLNDFSLVLVLAFRFKIILVSISSSITSL